MFDQNQLLWDLGLDVYSMDSDSKVREKVHELNQEFDLVLIAEKFDESLVLLQDLLCWGTKDLTYLKLNERIPSAKTKMTEDTRKLLKEWLWADYILYNHFKHKLQAKILKIPNLKPKLNELIIANEEIKAECVLQKGDNSVLSGKFKMALNIVMGYIVDESKPDCTLYAISEPHFSEMIHKRQNSM